MESLDELFRILRGQPTIGATSRLDERRYSALYYATEVLRLLRLNLDHYRITRHMAPGRRFMDDLVRVIRPSVASFFRGGMMAFRDGETHLRDIQGLLTQLADLENDQVRCRPVILARAVALAIDETALAAVPIEQFRNYYQQGDSVFMKRVRAGDPVPTCFGIFGRHDIGAQGSRKRDYGTNPQNLPIWRNPDRLPHVVLAPDIVESFHLRLNFDYERELANIQEGSTRFASFHPTKSIDQDISFRMHPDFDRFFDVRTRCADDDEGYPNNPEYPARTAAPFFATRREFRTWLKTAMEAAALANANLFIFPELILDQSDLDDVYSAWNELETLPELSDSPEYARPQLLIPGSWHLNTNPGGLGDRTNESELWGRPSGALMGQPHGGTKIVKVVPYAHQFPHPRTQTPTTIVEDINTSRTPELVIFCSQNATMLVLICVDFLLDHLRDLARDLYVSLLVIPSMSEKARVFGELMIGHVAATEAVAIFVDSLISVDTGTATLGIVRHPDREGSVDISTDTISTLDSERGVAVINLDAGRPEDRIDWRPCGASQAAT